MIMKLWDPWHTYASRGLAWAIWLRVVHGKYRCACKIDVGSAGRPRTERLLDIRANQGWQGQYRR